MNKKIYTVDDLLTSLEITKNHMRSTNLKVRVDSGSYENYLYFDGDYCSDRGDYSRLCLELSEEDKGFNTVDKVIEIIKSALEYGEMEGYKGGTYKIAPSTEVTLGVYGETGDAVNYAHWDFGDLVFDVAAENDWDY